ncbi:MAG: NAD(P)H-dependent oxidoreductase subunit E [Chloroflexi bacterium]|nr:NAD(P)H-dependent oxidoreductase subunit E [Chloroflexota bacterium]
MGCDLDLAAVDAIVAGIGREPRGAVPILQAIQERFGYLPVEALRRVCEITEIPPSRLSGVATFYASFRTRPAGRHAIRVCIGTACHVMGAPAVWEAFRRHLGIPEGDDTDGDRLFTVQKVACLGCCMLAPAVQIDDVTYGFVRPETVPGVLRDFLASRAPAALAPVGSAPGGERGEVRLCQCSSCAASGARRLAVELEREAAALRLPVTVHEVGCSGMAYQAPLVDVAVDGRTFRYGRVQPHQARELLLHHVRPTGAVRRLGAAARSLLERLLQGDGREPVTRYLVDASAGPDGAFLRPQCRLATADSGELDPLDLDAYRAAGGFEASWRCFDELAPDEVISQVRSSGLRGRGGAGFPTAAKMAAVRAATGDEKVVVCNGDEGDPGAFMDRMLLESFPFRVVEGMLIAARAVGARRGILYIRAEYPLAIERVRRALAICAERGLTGENGTDRSLRLEVVAGAGAFVCGEETALLAAIEGRRGTPRPRPPYPAERGLWGLPTLVNNVETFALLPSILRGGAARFAALGTAGSAGSKCFALAGKVARSGLVEVPMGITLRQIVEEVGGGVRAGRRLKAVQIGGPSGGCVPAWLADTPVDFDALGAAGSMMGSGGLVVLDDTDCMVDVARYFMAFTREESCGRCSFCRVGTARMLEILDRLCQGRGAAGDLERLEELAGWVQRGSLCGLGRTAPNPVLSTLRHFREEYEAHLEGRCPAGRCRELITYSITDACIGCTRCAQRCVAGAIAARPYERHTIDASACSRCGVCLQACPAGAVRVA